MLIWLGIGVFLVVCTVGVVALVIGYLIACAVDELFDIWRGE